MSGNGNEKTETSQKVPPEVTYHQAEEQDFRVMSDLCDLQGWNCSPESVQYLCSFNPEANSVARSGGQTIGFCVATSVGDSEAFICLMAVSKDFQRQGIGTRLLGRTLAALGDRNVTLYASPEGLPMYKKFGFMSDQKSTYLYQVRFIPDRDGLKDVAPVEGVRIVPLSKVDFDALIAYDTDVQRIPRREWVRPLADLADSIAALSPADEIVGYAGVEQDFNGKFTQIKPMLADSPEIAAMMLREIFKVTPEGHKVKIKILSENMEAMRLMEKIGFSTDIKEPDMIVFNKYKFQFKANKVFSVMNGWNQFA